MLGHLFFSSSHRLLIFSTPAELKASLPATAKAPQGVSKVNLKHYKWAKRSAPRLFAQLLRCARGNYTQHLISHLHLFTQKRILKSRSAVVHGGIFIPRYGVQPDDDVSLRTSSLELNQCGPKICVSGDASNYDSFVEIKDREK